MQAVDLLACYFSTTAAYSLSPNQVNGWYMINNPWLASWSIAAASWSWIEKEEEKQANKQESKQTNTSFDELRLLLLHPNRGAPDREGEQGEIGRAAAGEEV